MGSNRKKQMILVLFFFLAAIVSSQEEKVKPSKLKGNHFALGYCLNQAGKDFGIGLSLTSPYIGGFMAIKASENYQWLEFYDGSATIWKPYHTVKVGVVSVGTVINDQVRLYGEGGAALLILNPDFSSQQVRFGGYGLFGFEFFMDKINSSGMSYYIELGGIGTGASAEKLITKPIISNGFLITTGFRIYL